MRQARQHHFGRQQNRLSVEKLEDRSLMAGNVTAVVTGGLLVITGDTADNGVTIDYNQTTNAYSVIGTTPTGSTATTINSLDTSVVANAQIFTTVTKGIRIAMNAGNDNVAFGSVTSTSFVVDGFVDIDMGAGNDTLTIGRNGNAVGGVAPLENEVNIGASLAIKLGAGNDTLDITNTTITRDLVVHGDVNKPINLASDGNDTIRFPTTFTPVGGSLTVFPVIIGKKATILLGGGVDIFNGANVTANAGLFVQDLAGNLTFDLVDSRIGGELKLSKSGGAANNIELRNVVGGTVRLNTGNGLDTIAIRDSIFERMYLATAAGVDQITIGNTRVRKLGIIDGGRNNANLTQEAGNNLRGVVKRRTF